MNSITIQPLQIHMNIDSISTSGGTTNYEKLKNLPTLNGKTIIGNMTEDDPTVSAISTEDILRILK